MRSRGGIDIDVDRVTQENGKKYNQVMFFVIVCIANY